MNIKIIFCIFLIFFTFHSVVFADTSYKKAKWYYDLGEQSKAVGELIEVISDEHADVSAALKLLGSIYFDNNKLEKASGTWKQLLDQYPDSEAAKDIKHKYSDLIYQKRQFNFYGIKSGMTKKDIIKVLDLKTQALEAKEKDPYRYGKLSEDDLIEKLYFLGNRFWPGKKQKNANWLWFIAKFTKDGILWSITVEYRPSKNFRDPVNPIRKKALKEVLHEKYGMFEIKENMSNGNINLILLDDGIYQQILSHYKKQYP